MTAAIRTEACDTSLEHRSPRWPDGSRHLANQACLKTHEALQAQSVPAREQAANNTCSLDPQRAAAALLGFEAVWCKWGEVANQLATEIRAEVERFQPASLKMANYFSSFGGEYLRQGAMLPTFSHLGTEPDLERKPIGEIDQREDDDPEAFEIIPLACSGIQPLVGRSPGLDVVINQEAVVECRDLQDPPDRHDASGSSCRRSNADLAPEVFTSRELARKLHTLENTLRRHAFKAFSRGPLPQPLEDFPGWFVVERSHSQGGRNRGWKFQKRLELADAVAVGRGLTPSRITVNVASMSRSSQPPRPRLLQPSIRTAQLLL